MRIKIGIAKELKGRAMKITGARFSYDVDDAARKAAVLGIYIAAEDAELCN